MTDEATDPRIIALAAHLECDVDDIEEGYDSDVFEYGREEYRVLTDEEADQALVEYVTDTLWAFNASFLASETGLPEEIFEALQDKCEDANDAILAVVEKLAEDGVEGFAQEAVRWDGRGHFLSHYDGEEIDLCDPDAGMVAWHAYRVN